jgi:hypothetical protein
MTFPRAPEVQQIVSGYGRSRNRRDDPSKGLRNNGFNWAGLLYEYNESKEKKHLRSFCTFKRSVPDILTENHISNLLMLRECKIRHHAAQECSEFLMDDVARESQARFIMSRGQKGGGSCAQTPTFHHHVDYGRLPLREMNLPTRW